MTEKKLFSFVKRFSSEEKTATELLKGVKGINNTNFYIVLQQLEKLGFLIYEIEYGKTGIRSKYGLLGTVRGSKAEKYMRGEYVCGKGD